jgi:pimeloyl-ACP methyl ester carboxylesterase
MHGQAAAGIEGMRSRFLPLLLGRQQHAQFLPAVHLLNVDTYLRDTPVEAPPRARIFERYMSTLRYIARLRDADGHGYDEIVIVAHSLGALVSGDILQSRCSLEEKIPIEPFLPLCL